MAGEKPVEQSSPVQETPTGDKGRPPSGQDGGGPSEDTEYPPFPVVIAVMSSCILAMFLVALDRTIIATAIPYITDDFHSIQDIGWYGSSYMLANCSVQLLYGRIYRFYPTKFVLLCAIGLFEVGSAICGAAPNSNALIVGRAIAGAGSSGIMSGVIQVMIYLVPLSERPKYTGSFGAIFGVSSVLGPLLGGIFTEKISWRWCFYINLPFAAISIAAVVFLLKAKEPRESGATIKERIKQLDPIGTIIFIPSMVCLILALQWGGVTYSWSSGRLIALLVVFAVTFVCWIGVQIWKKDDATVPPRIFCQRSIAAGFTFTFLLAGSMMTLVYYLPIWFQAIKGVSPVRSGIDLLPFILALVASSMLSGFFVSKIGYYVPTMIMTPCFSSLGAGLMTTFQPATGSPHWVGYQFLYGFGIGMGMQQAGLAAQATLAHRDIPIGIALMFFGQQLGGALFVAVAQNVFSQKLVSGLSHIADLDPHEIVMNGATNIRKIVSPAQLPLVLKAYNAALVHTWYLATALTCAIIIPACCMEWKSIKGLKKGPGGPPGDKPKGPGAPSSAAPGQKSSSAPAGDVVPSADNVDAEVKAEKSVADDIV